MAHDNCIFCKIIRGEISAQFLHNDDDVIAIEDINKAAPSHVLVIPKEHIESVSHLTEAHDKLAGKIMRVGQQIAQQKGINKSGYRLVFNTGSDAGQSVHHIHMHVLGGRYLEWPPG